MTPVDIHFIATNPISQEWEVEGISEAGKILVDVYYPNGRIYGARWVANFKNTIHAQGMTHDTIFPEVMQRIGEPHD